MNNERGRCGVSTFLLDINIVINILIIIINKIILIIMILIAIITAIENSCYSSSWICWI